MPGASPPLVRTAMRDWRALMPLVNPADVTRAIQDQNVQIASGAVGAAPSPAKNAVNFPIIVKGQMTEPESFGAIVLRANPDGSNVRLRDVARIELGAESYAAISRINGHPGAGIANPRDAAGRRVKNAAVLGLRATVQY